MFYCRKTVRPAHITNAACTQSRLCTRAALLAFFILPVNALAALDLDETVRLALQDDPPLRHSRHAPVQSAMLPLQTGNCPTPN